VPWNVDSPTRPNSKLMRAPGNDEDEDATEEDEDATEEDEDATEEDEDDYDEDEDEDEEEDEEEEEEDEDEEEEEEDEEEEDSDINTVDVLDMLRDEEEGENVLQLTKPTTSDDDRLCGINISGLRVARNMGTSHPQPLLSLSLSQASDTAEAKSLYCVDDDEPALVREKRRSSRVARPSARVVVAQPVATVASNHLAETALSLKTCMDARSRYQGLIKCSRRRGKLGRDVKRALTAATATSLSEFSLAYNALQSQLGCSPSALAAFTTKLLPSLDAIDAWVDMLAALQLTGDAGRPTCIVVGMKIDVLRKNVAQMLLAHLANAAQPKDACTKKRKGKKKT
jgi:hypothetical protein